MFTDAEQLYTTWNVTVRNVLNLDRCTHRNLIEPLSECEHLKTSLFGQYVQFYQSLLSSKKFGVRYLARTAECDLRSVLGSTLSYLADHHPSSLTKQMIRMNMQYKSIPEDEYWRVGLSCELMELRHGNNLIVEGFTTSECEEILKFACTS